MCVWGGAAQSNTRDGPSWLSWSDREQCQAAQPHCCVLLLLTSAICAEPDQPAAHLHTPSRLLSSPGPLLPLGLKSSSDFHKGITPKKLFPLYSVKRAVTTWKCHCLFSLLSLNCHAKGKKSKDYSRVPVSMGEAESSAAACCFYFLRVVLFFKELLILKAEIIVFDRYLFLAVESLLNFESQ